LGKLLSTEFQLDDFPGILAYLVVDLPFLSPEKEPMATFQQVRFGKYLVLDKIAVGGMAELYQAKITSVEGFEKLVAIKKILPHLTQDANLVSMFIDEAKLAAMLTHQNIVQIYDLGSMEGTYYIAMEYIHGKDLRTILNKAVERKQPLPLEYGLHIICRVCAGLDYSHNLKDFQGEPLNIIHRDISPQNILVSYEGEIKIVDFGIAKAATKSTETRVGVIKGKLAYMSPEQAAIKSVDHRSDIFSTGIMLYEMVTGKRMFDGADLEILDRVREAQFEPPEMITAGLPPKLYEILHRSLAKDVELRYQSGSAMLADLQDCLSSFAERPSAEGLSKYMKKCFAEEIAEEARVLQRLGTEVPPEELPRDGEVDTGTGDRTVTVTTAVTKPKRTLWVGVLIAAMVTTAVALTLFLKQSPTSKSVVRPKVSSPGKSATVPAPAGSPKVVPSPGVAPSTTQPPAGRPGVTDSAKLDLALKALEDERFTLAVERFEEVLADDPSLKAEVATPYSQALNGLAFSILDTRPQRAKDLLYKAIEVSPQNHTSYFYLGKLYTSLKDYSKAIEFYQKAIDLNPRFPDSYFNLGFIYSVQRDFAKAESMFQKVIDLSPPYLDQAYFNLAMVQMKQRKKQESIANLEQVLKINPDNARAQKYLKRLKGT
jgi:Tfp pilus assembly protein PilF/tRNA A-37 threonylcarbamoyl transferase component Bud32